MSLWAAGEQRGRAASTEVATLEPTITITASAAAVLRTCERMGARLLIGFSLSEAGEAKAIRLSRNRADPRAAPAVAWKARAASLVAVVPVARKAAALVAVARKAEAALAVPEVRPGVAQGLMGGRGATAYLEVAAVGGKGGYSGYSSSSNLTEGGGGGGGGGGYYGGGGGGGGGAVDEPVPSAAGGGGGGGSSFAESRATHVKMWQGWYNAAGNGLVVFSW
jgi:hypothetical protein